MKHPYICGAALTAALFVAGLVANAALDRWANETLEGVTRCQRCGVACLHGAYETEGGYLCRECGRGIPSDWWVEE